MMIVSEKSYQNKSEYIQFLLKKNYNFIKKGLFLVKNINYVPMIMLTRSSKMNFIPSRYTGCKYCYVSLSYFIFLYYCKYKLYKYNSDYCLYIIKIWNQI